MYSFSNLEPIYCSKSCSNCCFLTCIQVSQEAGKVVWSSHFLKNFPQFVVIHAVKGFSVVNEAEVFLELSCFFYDPKGIGNSISGSSAFSKSSLYIWKFSVHVLLKPSLEDFEHDLAGMWNEDNCTLLWTFFGTALLWYWNENWPFSVLWPLLSFQICWHIPLFICLSLPGPVLCKLGQPGVLFVLPEVLTPVLGPSFVSFLQAFPFFVF